MAWKAHFEQNTGVKGIGTLTAIFVDDGGAETVVHSDRVDTNDPDDLEKFAVAAKAMHAKRQERKTDVEAVVTKILNKLEK